MDSSVQLPQFLTVKEKQFVMREFNALDFKKGFIELLAQLTVAPAISDQQFQEQFSKMPQQESNEGVYYKILIVEDIQTNKIISTGTLFVENNLLHTMGHIENIVTDVGYRGYGFAQLLMKTLITLSKSNNNLQLHCTEQTKTFYEKFGFRVSGKCLSKYN